MSSSSGAQLTGKVKGIINVQPIIRGDLTSLKKDDRQHNRNHLKKWFDDVTEFEKRTFLLELVSVQVNCERKTVKAQKSAKYVKLNDARTLFSYECKFNVPKGFGDIGAVLIQNVHHKETYVKNIVLDNKKDDGTDDAKVTFTCESWIHTTLDNTNERIFFFNKSYLPSLTPVGLSSLREKDLKSLQGNGKGERKSFERIYDYDTYNDLGVPHATLSGPDGESTPTPTVLGGEEYPYPRRCRTGRSLTSGLESRTKLPFYVPRDEEFSDTKAVTYGANDLYMYVHNLVPLLDLPMDMNNEFSSFSDVELLYDKCVEIIDPGNGGPSVLRRLLKDLVVIKESVLKMEKKRQNDEKSFSWERDEEFCRQAVAGVNPYSIQLVTEWPLKSKLEVEVYGPNESAITKKIVEEKLNTDEYAPFKTLEKAIQEKELFLLDNHDMLLPYVNKVRELEGTTLYGSRTLMFLTEGILKPIAIELTRPKNNEKPQWKHVYVPCSGPRDAKKALLWKLAKAHVLAHDSCHHQLISHWLRTHCVTEPYIIATHRCLSKLHPIHRLLSPHFRYTMQTNAMARVALINTGGIIESTFALGKYSMQFSSDAYKQYWRFDKEALPADLIRRGMAIEDPSKEHGLKLAIMDYPFATDGLILWDAVKQWATTYVKHYYPQSDPVVSDEELQAWWTEIKTKGHKDKKEGWPELKTQQDLIEIVTTIMWVASGHHAAVNFGQYTAGYSPNRPTIARTEMPDEDRTEEECNALLENPGDLLSECLPKYLSTIVITLLDILSTHSPDEEYIGVNMEPAWEAEPAIKVAFQEFNTRLKKLEETIGLKNSDPHLKNRIVSDSVWYELLKPFSVPGVTGKGVPYSISI